jgi:hypothetical protein
MSPTAPASEANSPTLLYVVLFAFVQRGASRHRQSNPGAVFPLRALQQLALPLGQRNNKEARTKGSVHVHFRIEFHPGLHAVFFASAERQRNAASQRLFPLHGNILFVLAYLYDDTPNRLPEEVFSKFGRDFGETARSLLVKVLDPQEVTASRSASAQEARIHVITKGNEVVRFHKEDLTVPWHDEVFQGHESQALAGSREIRIIRSLSTFTAPMSALRVVET